MIIARARISTNTKSSRETLMKGQGQLHMEVAFYLLWLCPEAESAAHEISGILLVCCRELCINHSKYFL